LSFYLYNVLHVAQTDHFYRTKELASQMGIDVAWNCAISLRPLDNGQEDPHRMISAYADWDVNARLPHGIEDVKRHLREVDNVPLLVSLFTDATEESTMDMVGIIYVMIIYFFAAGSFFHIVF
jgi:hypothetical protein